MLNIVIHASGVACFGYALYYDLFHVHLPGHMATSATFVAMKAFPGKWKYLTVWDIVSVSAHTCFNLMINVETFKINFFCKNRCFNLCIIPLPF